MCGRELQEKTLGQLKSGLAFATVPTQAYAANSAWKQLVALAHNLLVTFQIETGAPCRTLTPKRTVLPRLQSGQTLALHPVPPRRPTPAPAGNRGATIDRQYGPRSTCSPDSHRRWSAHSY